MYIFCFKSLTFSSVGDFSPGMNRSDLTNLSCLERGLLVAISLWALLVFLVSPWFRVWCCACGPVVLREKCDILKQPQTPSLAASPFLSLFSPHSLQGLTPHISPTRLGLSLALLLHPGLPLSLSWWPQAVKCYSISGLGSLSGPKFLSSPCKTLRKKECSFIMFSFSIFFLQPPLDDIFAQGCHKLEMSFSHLS